MLYDNFQGNGLGLPLFFLVYDINLKYGANQNLVLKIIIVILPVFYHNKGEVFHLAEDTEQHNPSMPKVFYGYRLSHTQHSLP